MAASASATRPLSTPTRRLRTRRTSRSPSPKVRRRCSPQRSCPRPAVTKSNPVALTEAAHRHVRAQRPGQLLDPRPAQVQRADALRGLRPGRRSPERQQAAKSNLSVVGDSTVTGGNWQPSTVGCYLLQSQVVTTNATPQATVNGPQLVLTVLDTVAAATPQHIVLGPGSTISESVLVSNSYQRPGALSSRVLGPLTPGSGDCTTADWSKAKSTAIAATKTAGDGTYTITSAGLAKAGCYQLQSTLLLAVDSRNHRPHPADLTSRRWPVLRPLADGDGLGPADISGESGDGACLGHSAEHVRPARPRQPADAATAGRRVRLPQRRLREVLAGRCRGASADLR